MRALLIAGLALAAAAISAAETDVVTFSAEEADTIRAMALRRTAPGDPTNRHSGDPRAISLGKRLFQFQGFSKSGKVSCASCHDPGKAWADGLSVAVGEGKGTRNTLSLKNVGYLRWLMWDGRVATLWSQATKPIENPIEMGGSRVQALCAIWSDDQLARSYAALFGAPRPSLVDETCSAYRTSGAVPAASQDEVNRNFSNVGKALAAFLETVVTGKSDFDLFAESLLPNQAQHRHEISASAKRGLKLFIGKANCVSCHSSSLLSDNEFHNIQLPLGARKFQTDTGRFDGARQLAKDEFGPSSPFSDARDTDRSYYVKQLRVGEQLIGQFRTPSLRNVANTAPYMHDGSMATLREVLEFYSSMKNAQRNDHHYESIVRPLNLTPPEIGDLESFLLTLSERNAELSELR